MKKKIKRWLQIVGGVFLILLGVVGLILPILQGIALIVLGIMVISPAHGKKILKRIQSWWSALKKWWKKNHK